MTRHLFKMQGLAIGIVLATLLVASNLAADVRSTYWGEVDTSNQATLQQTVHDTIRNHILVPYTSVNWPILEAADVDPSNPGHILDIYKNESYEITSGSRPYNREHVWPQSRGFPQGGEWSLHPRADMHNLYLCDVGYNSSRSNNYFDNCDDGCDERPTEFNNGVGGGSGVFPGNSNWRTSTTWQVWEDRKGDAARAVMYMAARYNGGSNIDGTPEPDLRLTDDINLLQTGAQPVAYMALQSVMLQWHQEDLPDSKEIFRHEVIYGAQQNRNPFIDFPEWGDCFFLGDCSSVAPMTPQNVIASNDGDDVTLTWSPRIETDLDGYHVYRSSTSGAGYARLTTDPISTTSFLDDTINPMDLYYYVVTAIDTTGNESIFSSEVTSQDFVGVAIAIPTNPDTPYIQDFDSMGTLVAASLPEHFRVAKSAANAQTGQIIWEDGVTVTDFRGGNSLSSSATNGIYNFGAGEPSTATDRAIGFLSSGSATKIGAVMAEFTNTSNEPLDGLNIKYDVEQYRNGSNPDGFSMRLRYSLDGESWSDAPGFTTNFSPGVDNSGFANAPGSVQNVAGDLPVSIPGNGTIFLKWRYSVTSGNTTTNAIALAVDNLELYGLTPPDTTPPLVAETVPPSGSLLNTMPSVSFTFDKPVTNVAAGELEVNGSAATDVSGEGAGPYIFTGFAPPADGTTTITLAGGTIEDLSGNLFAGIYFPITIDSVPPEVASISPGITGLINTFPTEISVTMTEPLDEFDPEAIVVNGSAATTISGSGAGPYIFSGYTLPEEGAGTVNFDGLRMTDAAGNAAVDVVYTFTLDTTPPVTTLVADTPHVAGPDVGFTYTVVEDNAVSGTILLARIPGSGTFEEASAAIDPVEGTIVYTAAVAGLHEFIAISEDMAGNVEAVDPANSVSVVVNPTENAPVTLEIAEGTDVGATFPMDSGIQATVTFDSVTVAGTLTIERIIGDLNAASLGLNTNRLAGQVYIITADGGLDFTTATISFEMDEAHFGMELVSIERVFINRGGTMTEVSGGDLVVAGSTVTVSGITAFSEWYFGDAATSVSDWMILID